MKRIALVLIAAAALSTGLLVGASGDSSQPTKASAAASSVCVRIGRVRWCFSSTAAEVAEVLTPAADLTGNGPPGSDGPPVGVTKITFNTPSQPGGQTTCTNAGTFMDCR